MKSTFSLKTNIDCSGHILFLCCWYLLMHKINSHYFQFLYLWTHLHTKVYVHKNKYLNPFIAIMGMDKNCEHLNRPICNEELKWSLIRQWYFSFFPSIHIVNKYLLQCQLSSHFIWMILLLKMVPGVAAESLDHTVCNVLK